MEAEIAATGSGKVVITPHDHPFLRNASKGHLIGGRTVYSQSEENLPTINPSTGNELALLSVGGEPEVDHAVRSARSAFLYWRRAKPSERQAMLLRLADLVDKEYEQLALLEALEMGRPINSALNMRGVLLSIIRFAAGCATMITGHVIENSFPVNMATYVLKEPIGVVAAITPWNAPLVMAAWKICPALAAGCTVVLKPAEDGSLSPLRFVELCLEAGIPPGVVNIVTGAGATGAALAKHADVDRVTFTGSCATGQKIMAASAQSLKRLTMELGGKSPNIIFADAILEKAIPVSGMGVFGNSGQICAAGARIFVERSIYADVVERFCVFARSLKVGPSTDSSTQIGPLVSEKQYRRVAHYLETGKAEGARLACGGKRVTEGVLADGYFVPPTVFADVNDDMVIAREEIFGPVACVLPFDTVDEVVQRANATQFGLAGGVWSSNITKAMTVARQIRAGTIWINHYFAMDAAVPYGGFKMSGYGREAGMAQVESYLETKSVWIAE